MSIIDIRQLEMTKRAKMYIEKLLKGMNPVDDSNITSDSVINNEKVQNCFSFILSILEMHEKVLEGLPVKNEKRRGRRYFDLSIDERNDILVSDVSLTVSEFVKNINVLIDNTQMKSLKATSVTGWLLRKGFMEEYIGNGGKKYRTPTAMGNEIGLTVEYRVSKYSKETYQTVLYNKDAQQFIVDNIGEIIEINREKTRKQKEMIKEAVIPEMPELNGN